MQRRTFLKSSLGVSTGLLLGIGPRRAGAAPRTPVDPKWRRFEVLTRVEVAKTDGIARAWIPVPLIEDTVYQRRHGDTWTGNARAVRPVRDTRHAVGLVFAEWPASERAPVLEVRSVVSTRDRTIDVERPASRARPVDAAALATYLAPTTLIPTDGIVRETAEGITDGLARDTDKARAIYEWIVENTFRDPNVQGCGLGDIKTMLETRYFGGKCADLNALYVGLARAAGIPARDVYGIRVADSAEFKSLGKSGDVSKAQHCRAECYLSGLGWVPVDPADVRKVVLEEKPGLTLADPEPQRARAKLFGSWEMNWLAYNYGHDVRLPGSAHGPVPFLMYPQAEDAGGRRDSLDPARFRYAITSRELTA